MMEEVGPVVLKEEMVLEKFDGEGEGAVLRERIVLVDQEVVTQEFFDEEGNLTNRLEGGNSNSTN